MEIYLIRHTIPAIEKGICYGQSDVPLQNTFKQEALAVLQKIPSAIEVIYTSPLVRCAALADFLAGHLNVPVVQDNRLKEMNFGNWEMKKWQDIEKEPLLQWMNNYEYECCPQGESYPDLVARVRDFTNTFKAPVGSIAIVTHAGVIKAFHAVVNNTALKDAMNVKVEFGGMITMAINQ